MPLPEQAPFAPNALQQIPGRAGSKDNVFIRTDNPDVVVKRVDDFNHGLDRAGEIKASFEELRLARQLFDELTEKYQIETTGFKPVLAEMGPRYVGGFVMSAFQKGEVFNDAANMTDGQRLAARDLLGKLTGYVIDKRQENQPYLADIYNLSQYSYDDEGQQFVLTDMDPFTDDSLSAVNVSFEYLQPWAQQVLGPEDYSQWTQTMDAAKATEAELAGMYQ